MYVVGRLLRQDGLASVHGRDRAEQVVHPGIFEEILAGAGADRGQHRVVIEHGEHEHGEVGMGCGESLGRGQPADSGQLRSMSTTSGLTVAANCSASSPVAASPTTVTWLGRVASSVLTPSR
jgi:hypothetical protein